MAHVHFYPEDKTDALPMQPKLLYTGIVINDPDWLNVAHSHEFCELLYVAGGRGHADIGSEGYELYTGDLVVINPGLPHSEQSSPADPLHLVFIGIDDFTLPGLSPCCLTMPGEPHVIRPRRHSKNLSEYFTKLIFETSHRARFYEDMCRSLCTALVVFISRVLLSGGREILSPECEKIKSYIDYNYSTPITLASLSDSLYISRPHLSHMFKKQTGVSPIRYLIERRISEACALLEGTEDSIAAIAAKTGYDDPVYFSQIFKRVRGVSPTAYRGGSRKL